MTIIHMDVTFIICKRAPRDEQRGTELCSNKVARNDLEKRSRSAAGQYFCVFRLNLITSRHVPRFKQTQNLHASVIFIKHLD